MRQRAASELSTRSTFFSSASHDFRQRLHAMKLLTQACAAESTRAQSKSPALVRLAGAVEDLEVYITDVLDFASLESGGLKPERNLVNLQDLFHAMNLEFETIADEKKVDMRIRTTDIRLRTDAAMLLRVLENLVANAIKFTSAGVLVAARPRGEWVAIEVWDQGPGIAEGTDSLIFEAFYRRNSAYHDHAKDGVGLGLAIVRRMAECLEYGIDVRSSPGKGTRMRVMIPAKDVIRAGGNDG